MQPFSNNQKLPGQDFFSKMNVSKRHKKSLNKSGKFVVDKESVVFLSIVSSIIKRPAIHQGYYALQQSHP